MTMLRRIGMFASIAVATALLSAPVAFADDGHGGRHRDGDDRGALQVNQDRHDNDANEIDNDDVEVVAVPAQQQQMVEVERELNDVVDDND
jgi:hypothetical protein